MPEAIALFGVVVPVVKASVLLAVWLSSWLVLRFSGFSGVALRQLESAVFQVVVVGFVSARVSFVMLNWQAYQSDMLSVFFVWQSGFLPQAGILGAGLFAFFRFRNQAHFFLPMLRGFAVAALLPISVLAATQWRLPNSGGLSIGEVAPNPQMQTLDQQPVLLSDLRGKTVVLNFWATWCPPCRREMPMLEQVAKQYQNKNVVVIGLETSGNTQKIQSAISEFGISYPIWLELNPNQKLLEQFGGLGLPTTLVIDPNGLVRQKYIGELSRAVLTHWLENP